MTETKEFYENFPEYNVLGFDEHLPSGADESFDLYFVSKDSRESSRRKEIKKRFRQKEKEAEAEIIAAAQRKAKAENKARHAYKRIYLTENLIWVVSRDNLYVLSRGIFAFLQPP